MKQFLESQLPVRNCQKVTREHAESPDNTLREVRHFKHLNLLHFVFVHGKT